MDGSPPHSRGISHRKALAAACCREKPVIPGRTSCSRHTLVGIISFNVVSRRSGQLFPLPGVPMKSSTIFAASVLARGTGGHMLVQDPRIDLLHDGPAGQRRFKIKTAEYEDRRSRVNSLLKDRYAWRGYGQVTLPTHH